MSALTIVCRLGEILDPTGHLFIGRSFGQGLRRSGPWRAQWDQDCSYATSPESALTELAHQMIARARVQAEPDLALARVLAEIEAGELEARR